MPHITTAMERSMRRSVGDIIVASLRPRDIIGEASSVKNSFSSWSNCMAASYCKWPVIIAIVIVSLIVLSIVTCIARCCCCGYSCCCSCFSFLKCCDCCGDSCAGKKDKPMKHLDDPYFPPPRQGYQAPAPMMAGAAFGSGAAAAHAAHAAHGKPEPPQYAQFEVGKSGLAVDPKAGGLSEDALPPMPSWETATKKHVLTEEEKNAVELGELDPATGQKVPLMTGAAPAGTSMPPSPVNGHSPYGAPGQAVGGAYSDHIPGDHHDPNQAAFNGNGRAYGGAAPVSDPHAQNGRGYGGGTPPVDPYAQNQGAYNGNGRGGYGAPQSGPGRGGPGRGGPGRGYGPQGQDFEGQGRAYGASQQDPYTADAGYTGAAVGGYGRAQPNREYSNNSNNSGRPFPPQPQRQYSSDSARPLNSGRGYSDRPYPADNFQPGRMASPPLNNNSGFDFGTNNQQPYSSRPSPPLQQMSYESSNPGGRPSPPLQGNGGNNGYSRSPNQQGPQEPSYPGYRPYQAPGQGSRGPMPSSAPGPRGGREPQRWDPVRQ